MSRLLGSIGAVEAVHHVAGAPAIGKHSEEVIGSL